LKKSVGIERVDVVKGNLGRAMRLRASGDENDFGAKMACAVSVNYRDGVGILERCLTANKLDVVQLEIFEYPLAFHFDDFPLVVHEILYGKIFLERVIDAIEAALLESGKIERRLAQRLAGDGARIDAASAHVRGALDDSDTLSKISGLRASFFSGRAAPDYDKVEVIVSSHLIPH
jgi:hypothetical protein